MTLLIVGTGRSGTLSAVTALGGTHEPYSEVLVPLAPKVTYGYEHAATIISQTVALPEVSAHYKYAELLGVFRQFGTFKVLWVTRDRTATIESMVRQRWYLPADDTQWPMSLVEWDVTDGNPFVRFNVSHPAHRTNPVGLGWMRWADWAQVPQSDRCAWWVDFVTELLEQALPALDVEYRVCGLSDLAAELPAIASWAGVECGELPHLNRSVE